MSIKILFNLICLFLYLKSLLVGFNTNHVIKEVVIDEAQDYNKLQYLIIKRTKKMEKILF